jgi:hypothetical protein
MERPANEELETSISTLYLTRAATRLLPNGAARKIQASSDDLVQGVFSAARDWKQLVVVVVLIFFVNRGMTEIKRMVMSPLRQWLGCSALRLKGAREAPNRLCMRCKYVQLFVFSAS